MTNLLRPQLIAASVMLCVCGITTNAKTVVHQLINNTDTLSVVTVGENAYRVKILPAGHKYQDNAFYLPEASYGGTSRGSVDVDGETITFGLGNGNVISQSAYSLVPEGDGWACSVTLKTPADESQYGTGQFQDGYLDVKGLARRLTQVNTQISVPMIISDAGYGILWNNNGMTEFNPCTNKIELIPAESESEAVKVNVTGTEGNRQEERRSELFTGTLSVPADGDYTLLLDCGQSMARKHYLEVDGIVLTEAYNIWLPPTVSVKTHLTKGEHHVTVKGDRNDRPTLFWDKIDGYTSFASPVSQGVDYTVFIGTPDEIIAQMRQLTGQVPMLPKWALGYIHCRERYDTQSELLSNATEFRQRQIPVDVIVQDWQWWGKNGWNAMHFDEEKYPDPKAMTDSLHNMDMRIMLSVWAKVDKNSELGKELDAQGHYIPGTDWIDFFSPEAAEAYWTAYRDNLLPTGIDAWWQDATEPENDDLKGRTVAAGTMSGDAVRNVFPIAVNDRVYRGLCEERPDRRPMILTRCGAPGLQRYGAVTWSGDVGNDWQTLQRQIKGGLGQMATGLPWWTYDAGGFFRPGDQYQNEEYQQRMLRWIQNAVFLPFMRVHGYMSQTEPWRYSPDTYDKFVTAINHRYHLVPYLYSCARKVSSEGYTLMRPLVFDFADDKNALGENFEYMLGPDMLVCPVTSPENVTYVYLPDTQGGWYDIFENRHYSAGKQKISLSDTHIPVFVKAGAILPWAETDGVRSTDDITGAQELTLRIFPGADGDFTLYDDDGVSNDYANGEYSMTRIHWNDATRTLTIDKPQGKYRTPVKKYNIVLPDGSTTSIVNKRKTTKIKL